MNQKTLMLSVIIVIGVIVGGIWYYSGTKKNESNEVATPGGVPNNSAPQVPVITVPTDSAQVTKGDESTSTPLVSSKTPSNFMHTITLKTNFGDIQFETYDADAPKTSENFLSLSKKGFYNNLTFHRVIKGFMIQGGDPKGDGTGGPGYSFEDELNPAAESYKNGYKKGVVAMANAGPNTNGSQFFIMLADYPLPNSYTIFGKVVKGQEIVDAIGNVQTGSQDRPLSPVSIKSVVIEDLK